MDSKPITVVRAYILLVVVTMLLHSGCGSPKMPQSCDSAVLQYSSKNGRITQVKTIINGDAPLPPAYSGLGLSCGKTTLVVTPSLREQGEILLKYFDEAYNYFENLRITPLPKIHITLVQVRKIPKHWTGVIKDNLLTTILYIPPGDFIEKAGKWNRLDDTLASQILGTWHELLELSMIFGDGVRIGFGDDEKLRWLREGLSTYLAERTLYTSFLCRPYKDSKLEYKYYYATKVGEDILRWKESAGKLSNVGYAASLGVMHIANEASQGAFPWKFLQACSANRYKTPEDILHQMELSVNSDLRSFLNNIRRPLPDLLPATIDGKVAVPSNYKGSPDAPTLKPFDIISAIDNKTVHHPFELDLALWLAGKKEDFLISVYRENTLIDVYCRPVAWRHKLEKQ